MLRTSTKSCNFLILTATWPSPIKIFKNGTKSTKINLNSASVLQRWALENREQPSGRALIRLLKSSNIKTKIAMIVPSMQHVSDTVCGGNQFKIERLKWHSCPYAYKIENSISTCNVCEHTAMVTLVLPSWIWIRREAVHNFRASSRHGAIGCKMSK